MRKPVTDSWSASSDASGRPHTQNELTCGIYCDGTISRQQIESESETVLAGPLNVKLEIGRVSTYQYAEYGPSSAAGEMSCWQTNQVLLCHDMMDEEVKARHAADPMIRPYTQQSTLVLYFSARPTWVLTPAVPVLRES